MTAQTSSGCEARKSQIYFPELPTPERVRQSLKSYWSHSRTNVFAVYARRKLRWWSATRGGAEAWANHYLYGAFEIKERKPRLVRA
jgi:hypothetical protein